MKLTQKRLILYWLAEVGSITPAVMAGRIYRGQMFGSETSKRCREMRKAGLLESHAKDKFEVFTIKPLPPAVKPMPTKTEGIQDKLL